PEQSATRSEHARLSVAWSDSYTASRDGRRGSRYLLHRRKSHQQRHYQNGSVGSGRELILSISDGASRVVSSANFCNPRPALGGVVLMLTSRCAAAVLCACALVLTACQPAQQAAPTTAPT